MARRASPPDLDPRRRNTMSTAYYNDQAARQQIAASLSKLLADTYTLYLKTQGFHWNVTGPRFHDLHKLFEEQYNELADANDEIAERIRALGAKAPASYSEFKKLATLSEETGAPAPTEMIRQLLADNGSADLATQRVRAHEKAAWMLDALLQSGG